MKKKQKRCCNTLLHKKIIQILLLYSFSGIYEKMIVLRKVPILHCLCSSLHEHFIAL